MDNDSHRVGDLQKNVHLAESPRGIVNFGARCREVGLADTPQRRMIYRCLADSRDHPTVEAVFTRIRQHLPRVSLATVYRNLKLFAEAGLIDEVCVGGSRARYDADRSPHHHLICEVCGDVSDHYSEDLNSVGPSDGMIGGFEVHRTRVNFLGLCSNCQQVVDAGYQPEN